MNKTPFCGNFTSAAGHSVRVRAATIAQLIRIDAAGASADKAESVRAGAALIQACAEVEGFDDPLEALTIADFAEVLRISSGGGDADFR